MRGGMTLLDDARSLVARSTAAQGLPERVTDPGTLARVAVILNAARESTPVAHTGADAYTVTTTATVAKRGGRSNGT